MVFLIDEILKERKSDLTVAGLQGYLDFWRCQTDSPLAPYLDALFGNLEDVYRFNAGLLSHLERSGLDPVRVARCFVNHNHGFAIYTEYCTNYPR